MDAFSFRDGLVDDSPPIFGASSESRTSEYPRKVDEEFRSGLLWPDPLIQLNPAFEPAERVDEMVAEGMLHQGCADICQLDKGTADQRPLARIEKAPKTA